MSVAPSGRTRPTVAIAHDYLTQFGGAERVVLAMHRAFPDAPLATTLFDPAGTFPEFSELDVQVSALNRFAALRRHHRVALPLLPAATQRMHVDADVVLCSSSGWAHGIDAAGAKVVYCHTPARWLYGDDQAGTNALPSWATKAVLRVLGPPLRRWDHRAASTVDRFLANSQVVADRISSIYDIQADVLYPPVAVDVDGPQHAPDGIEPGYLLCVARLMPYKNVEAVAEAVAGLSGQRLVIVGDGPAAGSVRAAAEAAPSRITMFPRVSDNQLRWLYANAQALVCASPDDFGLTPVEAAAFGVPTVGLRANGLRETIIEDETGAFFAEPTPADIADGITRLTSSTWYPEVLRGHAAKFSEKNFATQLRQVVGEFGADLATVTPATAPVRAISAVHRAPQPASASPAA